MLEIPINNSNKIKITINKINMQLQIKKQIIPN